ncbi:transmembrane protein PMIS2 [Peromyscus californicus insignis]|uniref:transmembrane protein PMIS2 n=1 Tax=Peromyscus californicus insignis TaxID=564181 RepID=UPI0022A68336|nr:transmembrane protein PMIS2 [Peromyscus californicus insignis]
MAADPGPKVRVPLDRPQTSEELAFYARSHTVLTICALLLFPPFGLLAIFFAQKVKLLPRHCSSYPQKPIPMLPLLQTKEANQYSDWEDAYLNSARTIWIDVIGILVGLGIIYFCVLYV